jgi:hypothetical protein
VSGTLLGPEGSGVFVLGFSVRTVPAGRTAAASEGPSGFLGVWLAPACGFGSARILRTTQWTRASL